MGQVVGGTLLPEVPRGQVYGDPPLGKLEAGIADGRAHPLPGLLDGRIRQADDVESWQARRNIHLHLDQNPLKADGGGGIYPGRHRPSV